MRCRPVLFMLMALAACGPPLDDTGGEEEWQSGWVGYSYDGATPRLRAAPDRRLWAATTQTVWQDKDIECEHGSLVSTVLSVLELDLDRATHALSWQLGIGRGGPEASFDLAVDPDGEPWLAVTSGEAMDSYCGPEDLSVVRPDGDEVVLVRGSDEVPSGEPDLDAGTVVGFWPSLAFDAQGEPVVAYQDRHDGSGVPALDDLELFRGSGQMIHSGHGHGEQTRLALDAEGRGVVITLDRVDVPSSLWMWRETTEGWAHEAILDHIEPLAPPDLVLHPDGTVSVAMITGELGLEVYRQPLPDAAWASLSPVREGIDEPEAVVAELLSDGRLVLAWASGSALTLVVEDGSGGFAWEEIPTERACEEIDLALVDDTPHVLAYCPDEEWTDGTALLHAWRGKAL